MGARELQAAPTPSESADRAMHDMDAEGAVLCNVLYLAAALDEVRGVLQPEHFGSERHRRVYEAMLEIVDAGEALNVVTVATRLRENGRLAQVGGMAYLTELTNAAPVLAPSHLRTHAKTVRCLWARRELAAISKATEIRCGAERTDVAALLGEVRTRVDELSSVVAATEQSTRADAVVKRALASVVEATKSEGRGVRPSGFDRLDRLTAGLHDELTIIGARPGMGKTSLSTCIATNVARGGDGVFIASLETVEAQLMTRMLSAEARVDVHRARVGALTQTEWDRFGAAAKTIEALPIWVDDTSGMTVADLWAKCRRIGLQLAREGRKLGLVVVDYVQLLRAPRVAMKREEVVGENARSLKAMAQELHVTVLGLAQLNRDVDKRTDRQPQLSDLRESGELEQCARTVLLLYREDYYRKQKPGYRPTGIVEVHVAKQNNGPTGLARLRFDEACTRFENLPEGQDGRRQPSADPRLCAGCGQKRVGPGGRCAACAWLVPGSSDSEAS